MSTILPSLAQRKANSSPIPHPPKILRQAATIPVDWTRKLPTNAKTERYKQGRNIAGLGGPPCVQFVPYLKYPSAKRQTFQMKVGGGKANYTKFDGSTCEDALRHILKYCQLLKKLCHRKTFEKA